jgi:hypothetical protein
MPRLPEPIHNVLTVILLLFAGLYVVLLYLDTRRCPESLFNGPTQRGWLERRLDGLSRYIPPVIVILCIVVFGPDIVEDQMMLARDPTHPGPGHIAHVIHSVLRAIF